MKFAAPAALLLFLAAGAAHAAVQDAPPERAEAVRLLSDSIQAPERTRDIVHQVLDETNDSQMSFWISETDPAALRWQAFYRDADRHFDYEALAVECIDAVYPRYFSDGELSDLAAFLHDPEKTRSDITAFAATPLGRKYRAVQRRMSGETAVYLQLRVRSIVGSALNEE